MSELAVTVLQFGLLLLLWILILSIIGAQGRDMTISKRSRARAAASGPSTAPGPRTGPPAP
ncbi:FHA domain-containing protein, partial [Nesterenkonia halotolerans]